MRKGRRVYDLKEQRFVTGWLGRKEARVARNTIEALTPDHERISQYGYRIGRRFICTTAKDKRAKR